MKRVVNGKSGGKGEKEKAVCYLPKAWAEEEPEARNRAIILTFRHFVKVRAFVCNKSAHRQLFHQAATSASPFSYPTYTQDVEDLLSVHPVAVYRRLVEPCLTRRKVPGKDMRAWLDCMDRWGEELGAREKTWGNKLIGDNDHMGAIMAYSRAISLDPKKTVYFTNRAVAYNAIGEHARAETDCRHIIAKDGACCLRD